VLSYDDAVGIVPAGQGYTVVLEGNESHDAQVLPGMVLQEVLGGETFAPQMVELSGEQFPFREVLGAMLAMGAVFLGSVVMGLLIVEDKEARIMQALGVSPMSRREYVAARSLLVYLLSFVMVYGSLWVMGLTQFDYLLVFAVLLVGGIAAVLAGFVLGSISGNQIAAIANMKFGFLLVLMPPLMTFLIPENYWFALYWAPTYWTFSAYRAVLQNAGWAEVLPMLAWNLGVTLVFLAIAYRWLQGKLDFARA
jgi:ABC-2 type transport system permease protein